MTLCVTLARGRQTRRYNLKFILPGLASAVSLSPTSVIGPCDADVEWSEVPVIVSESDAKREAAEECLATLLTAMGENDSKIIDELSISLFENELIKELKTLIANPEFQVSALESILLGIQKLHITVLATHFVIGTGTLIRLLLASAWRFLTNLRVQRVLNVTVPPAA